MAYPRSVIGERDIAALVPEWTPSRVTAGMPSGERTQIVDKRRSRYTQPTTKLSPEAPRTGVLALDTAPVPADRRNLSEGHTE